MKPLIKGLLARRLEVLDADGTLPTGRMFLFLFLVHELGLPGSGLYRVFAQLDDVTLVVRPAHGQMRLVIERRVAPKRPHEFLT